MKVICKVVFLLLICELAGGVSGKELTGESIIYRGTSDSSAGVAVSKDMIVVADDENNVLRVYQANKGGLPIFSYDLTDFLEAEREHPEADIEGATMIGDRIYWITSHGRNKNGKPRPSRYRFFATQVKTDSGRITIHPVGRPYRYLTHHLVETETMRHLGLDKATRFGAELSKKERKKLAPKEQGLNIEALCRSADGKTVYIGFRNPRPRVLSGRSSTSYALVVPLQNAAFVIERGQRPVFGRPILWDLGGLGLRSMEYSPYHKAYFIIAGAADEQPNFAIYRWSGQRQSPPVLLRRPVPAQSEFTPEALITFRALDRFLLLSDDGSVAIKVRRASECMDGKLNDDGTCPNKYLTNSNKKTFRGIWLTPQES